MLIGLIFIFLNMILFFIFALRVIHNKEYIGLIIFSIVYLILLFVIVSKLYNPNLELFQTDLAKEFIGSLIIAIGLIVAIKYKKNDNI